MALANFFKRAAQALGQVLTVANPDLLALKLEQVTVAVAFDDTVLDKPNTSIILNMSVNLLSRLYPRLTVYYEGNSQKGWDLKQTLEGLALAINPDIELTDNTAITASICVGETGFTLDQSCFVSADSWNLEVSPGKPCSVLQGNCYNPISSAAAACFGADEVFRCVFADLLGKLQSEKYVFSLLDYKKTMSVITELPEITLKDLTIVGIGAVGNATIWCLNLIPSLSGRIALVDHEQVDLTNLQRYVLADQNTVDVVKTDMAFKYLDRPGLEVKCYAKEFGEHVTEDRPDCDFDVIAVAVDNIPNRVAAQAVLPRVIINAWTDENARLSVSRHWFGSGQACLSCIYLLGKKQKSYTEQIAELTGLEHNFVSQMYIDQKPLTEDILKKISEAKGYPMDKIVQFSGLSLDKFREEVVCGGYFLELGVDVKHPPALVPLAHQSVLAGTLLAAEIVKLSLGITTKDDPAEIRITMLAPPTDYTTFRLTPSLKPGCICQDEDYLFVYSQKYN